MFLFVNQGNTGAAGQGRGAGGRCEHAELSPALLAGAKTGLH